MALVWLGCTHLQVLGRGLLTWVRGWLAELIEHLAALVASSKLLTWVSIRLLLVPLNHPTHLPHGELLLGST